MPTQRTSTVGQRCPECGSTNHDAGADYVQDDGIVACSQRCYQEQLARARLVELTQHNQS